MSRLASKYPLHEACKKGQLALAKQICKKEKRSVLDVDGDQRTPLHYAARGGQLAIVKWALSKKARLNAQDSRGWTPLHDACDAMQLDVVNCLLDQKGVRLDMVTIDGNSVLHYLARAEEVQHFGTLQTIIQRIHNMGVSVDPVNKNNQTPLFYASRAGIAKTIGIFLLCSANINALDSLGETPLHSAARDGHFEACKTLVEAGANCNVQSKASGFTPYELAIHCRRYDVARYLAAHTADTSTPVPAEPATPAALPAAAMAGSLGPTFQSQFVGLLPSFQGPGWSPLASVRGHMPGAPVLATLPPAGAVPLNQLFYPPAYQAYSPPQSSPSSSSPARTSVNYAAPPAGYSPPVAAYSPVVPGYEHGSWSVPPPPVAAYYAASPVLSTPPPEQLHTLPPPLSDIPPPTDAAPDVPPAAASIARHVTVKSVLAPFGGLDLGALLSRPVQLKDELDQYLVGNLKAARLAVSEPVVHLDPASLARDSGWTPAALAFVDQINVHALLTSAHMAAAAAAFDAPLTPACLHPLQRAHLHSAIESVWISCRAAIKLDQTPAARDYAPPLFLSLLGRACAVLQRLGAVAQAVPFAVNVLALMRNYGVTDPHAERLHAAANAWCHYVDVSKQCTGSSFDGPFVAAAYDEAKARAARTDLVAAQLDQAAALLRHTPFSVVAESRHRLLNQLTVFLQAEERDRVVRDPLELHPSCLPDPALIVAAASVTRPTLCALAGRMFESLLVSSPLPSAAAGRCIDDYPSFCRGDQLTCSSWYPRAVAAPAERHVRFQYLQRLLCLGDGRLLTDLVTLFKRTATSRSVFCSARCITTIVIAQCAALQQQQPPLLAAAIFEACLPDFNRALLLMLFNGNNQIRYEALLALSALHAAGLKDLLLDQAIVDQVQQIVAQPRGSLPYELVLAVLYMLQTVSRRCSEPTRLRDFVARCSLAALMRWSELHSVRARLISLIACLAHVGDVMGPLLADADAVGFLLNHAHEAGNLAEIQRAVWLLAERLHIPPPSPALQPLVAKLLEDTDDALKGEPTVVPLGSLPYKVPSLLFRAYDLYTLAVHHQQAARHTDSKRCFHGVVTLCRDILRWFPRDPPTIAFLTRTRLMDYV